MVAVLLASGGIVAAPDEDKPGRAQGYPVGASANWFSQETVPVDSFTHQADIEGLLNGHVHELAASSPYRCHIAALRNLALDDYLARQRVMGLLVMKEGVIQVERHQ